ncbi:cell division protein PerM [Herbiconiux sp. YIM B11900]|uniref:cell division protein PerM n=1 Tax=Herbiconiux sp. YIM B11900 TaxID=3404131 RepID=UPI003F83810F
MNRPVTALLAALDAVIVVAIGVGIPLVPLTILWATQFGLAIDWLAFWRASADLWLLGNGVDLLLTVDPDLALRLALEGAGVPFEVGLAPLGLALITALLGVRAGRRLAATPYPVTAAVVGTVAVGALSLLVCLSAREAAALPSLAQSILFPAGVYALGTAIGAAWTARRTPALELGPSSGIRRRWRARLDRVDEDDRGLVALVFRAGALAAAAVIALSAIAMALILVVNFSSIVSLYESLQAGLVGGISLTVAQLVLLPNLIVWTASWFVGPGFAIGAGSAVSPLGTQLGLVPALPVLGALPQGTPALGFVGLLVPVLAGFATAAVLRPVFLSRVRGTHGRGRIVRMVIVAAGAGAVGASILALLALWSGGAAGPGRLAEVGPDAGWVWVWAFLEFSVPMLLGLIAGAKPLTARSEAPRSADTL